MTDYAPILIAVLFVIISMISAAKNGVYKLLSSGCAAAIGMIVFFGAVHFLPAFIDADLTWKAIVGIAGGAFLVVYLISRLIFGAIFKAVFNIDSPLHGLVDGAPGAILSLFPSLVVAFFIFSCTRIAGTVQELDYVASLSQEGIATTTARIPDYPFSADWRNGVEAIPGLAPLLDLTDPFSNRLNRNAAAFVIMSQSAPLSSYLMSQPETEPIASNEDLNKVRQDPEVYAAIEKHDRVGLVLNLTLQKTARSAPISSILKKVELKPALVGFAYSISSQN